MKIIVLSRAERAAIKRLDELHTKYPANNYGFLPGSLGSSEAAAARRIEHTGLVRINRIAENCFRYSLTDAGKERAVGYRK